MASADPEVSVHEGRIERKYRRASLGLVAAVVLSLAGVVTLFGGTGISVPQAITVGPDGALWFTNHGNDSIGRITIAGDGERFHPVALQRLLDSRAGATQVGDYATPWGTDTTRSLRVAERVGIPDLAEVVVANVTVTDTGDDSYLTLWLADPTRPTVSSLNWTAGETIPNAVTVSLGTGGAVSIYNLVAQVDVLVDVAGWYG